MKNKTLYLLLTMMTLLLLTACGGGDQNNTGTTDPDANNGDAYTVEHAMGTETIPSTPERIVVLTNEGTEALLAMGVQPVGAVQSWLGDPWYEHIAADMEGVQVVGTESAVNLEAIAALQPDLIIGNKLRQEEVYEQLKGIAPTVFAETLKGDWKENFQLYSKAINKEEKGNEVLSAFDSRVEQLSSDLGDQLQQEVSIVRFLASEVRIYLKDSFSGIILEQLGFARPEAQNVNDFAEAITKERMHAMEGDILFYFTYETGEGDATGVKSDWTEDPLFQNLEVVKSGRVHEVSDAIWNTAGGVIAANKMLDDIERVFLTE